MRAAFLFSGRGSNLEVLLRECASGMLRGFVEPALAITDRSGAGGLAIASRFGVPRRLVQAKGRSREAYDEELVAILDAARVELVVLAGFLRILSPVMVRRFPGRILNIHPADTREHRGLHGYRWAFEQGLDRTWVTVHVVDEGLDTGPVVMRAEVDLDGAATEAEIERRGLAVEHDVYRRAVLQHVRHLERNGEP